MSKKSILNKCAEIIPVTPRKRQGVDQDRWLTEGHRRTKHRVWPLISFHSVGPGRDDTQALHRAESVYPSLGRVSTCPEELLSCRIPESSGVVPVPHVVKGCNVGFVQHVCHPPERNVSIPCLLIALGIDLSSSRVHDKIFHVVNQPRPDHTWKGIVHRVDSGRVGSSGKPKS